MRMALEQQRSAASGKPTRQPQRDRRHEVVDSQVGVRQPRADEPVRAAWRGGVAAQQPLEVGGPLGQDLTLEDL